MIVHVTGTPMVPDELQVIEEDNDLTFTFTVDVTLELTAKWAASPPKYAVNLCTPVPVVLGR